MKNIFFVITFLFLNKIQAQALPAAFTTVPATYTEKPNTKIIISNMPRVRSQDSLGICFGFAAATLAQKYYCDEKIEIIPDCSNVPPEREISPIHMTGFTDKISDRLSISNILNYNHILIKDTEKGRSEGAALINSQNNFSFYSEACVPFDQFAAKYGQSEDMANGIISHLENVYNKHKTNSEAIEACEECVKETVQEVNKVFSTNRGTQEVKNALKRDTFGEFLYAAAFSGCKKLVKSTSPKFFNFPKKEEVAAVTKDDYIKKVTDVLKLKVPLTIGGICTRRNPNGSCKGTHVVVVSGYQKVCKPNNECRDLFKVQNSWGVEWQQKYNDGWVDADALLTNMQDENKKLPVGSMSWITQ